MKKDIPELVFIGINNKRITLPVINKTRNTKIIEIYNTKFVFVNDEQTIRLNK